MKGYLTTREAADIYGRHADTIRIWCKKGILPAKKIGGRWYIPRDQENLDERE